VSGDGDPGAPGAPAGSGAGGDTKAREHLANERTLLAWVRTAIGLMGLGFVVARFGIFVEQLRLERLPGPAPNSVLSAAIGTALVATGVIAGGLGAIRFLRARAQIERGRFEPEAFAELTIVLITIAAGITLVVYLATTS
jgi:putative membrane protein